MFKKQPNGLYVLALANTGERFGYYTMLAIFLLFLQAKFGFDATISGQIYAGFLAVVYFMPLIGGVIADKWSFSKCVVTGIFVMLFGYLVMSLVAPWFTGNNAPLWVLIGGLFLISCGTGLFKGNLQVMVGDLYNSPEREGQRDSAFSIFYMAINIGSMFAPMMATAMLNVAHGAGLACIFPAWLLYVAKRNPDMAWKFAINVMSVNPQGLDTDHIIAHGISTLKQFYNDLGLTTSLRELIGEEPDIDAMVESLRHNIGDTLGNYMPLSMDDCKEIYRLAL